MKSIRIMILGIGLLLLSIFCEIMALRVNFRQFWAYYFPIGSAIVGILCLVLGLLGVFEE